jgi:hypothetical protein
MHSSRRGAFVIQAHLVLDEVLGSGFVMDVNHQSVTAPLSKLPVQATRSSTLKP